MSWTSTASVVADEAFRRLLPRDVCVDGSTRQDSGARWNRANRLVRTSGR
jgi:hypothetical protein